MFLLTAKRSMYRLLLSLVVTTALVSTTNNYAMFIGENNQLAPVVVGAALAIGSSLAEDCVLQNGNWLLKHMLGKGVAAFLGYSFLNTYVAPHYSGDALTCLEEVTICYYCLTYAVCWLYGYYRRKNIAAEKERKKQELYEKQQQELEKQNNQAAPIEQQNQNISPVSSGQQNSSLTHSNENEQLFAPSPSPIIPWAVG
jgi:hypothetical protein